MNRHEPYPHQKRAAELLLMGRNVILQAPTGAGKTMAALSPFLNARTNKRDFASKCLYIVPMRVLANQFAREYENFGAKIQTGEAQNDPYFESDLIFTTIDQVLSRFLNYPYGVSRRYANLNAAAVMGSYLVFDEFHLFDPDSTLPTTLQMLRMLNGIAPFMLMTATFSGTMLHKLADLLHAEIIPATQDERDAMLAIPSQDKTRRYHVSETPLTAEVVLDAHARTKHKRTLVICNTVDRARRIADELRRLSSGTEVLLLHSRFLPDDRAETEARLQEKFGKTTYDLPGDVIAVATQAVEVGVDITSDHLHTELAPANSIIQRAGRCARYPKTEGDVTIYRFAIAPDDQGNPEVVDLCERVNPYSGSDQKEIIRLTWEAFAACSGSVLTFADEQAILSDVHAASDERLLMRVESEAFHHRRQMLALMRDDYNADPSSLIRKVFQQRVTISSNPNSLLDAPFDAPSFGLRPQTLQKAITWWLATGAQIDPDALPFCVKMLIAEDPSDDPTDAEANRRPRYYWEDVRTAKQILGAPLVVVHPRLARYDPERGFVTDEPSDMGDPEHWEARLPDNRQRLTERSNFTYRLETYETHIKHVYESAFGYDGSWQEMKDVAARLERRFGWEAGVVRRVAELAVLFHDVGKLSEKWQKWVRDYQAQIDMPVYEGEAYAHTELQKSTHLDVERKMPRRPWHAVESALASAPVVQAVLGDDLWMLSLAVYSAIARHHAPFSAENQAYRLIRDAGRHVWTTLPEALRSLVGPRLEFIPGADANADPQRDNIADLNDDPSEDEVAAYWVYILLARVLRRADQEGTRRGSLPS